jgi:hypothetical protein
MHSNAALLLQCVIIVAPSFILLEPITPILSTASLDAFMKSSEFFIRSSFASSTLLQLFNPFSTN